MICKDIKVGFKKTCPCMTENDCWFILPHNVKPDSLLILIAQ